MNRISPKKRTLSAITGCMGEPWHYRYVGKRAAREIFEQGLCLEEYVQQKNGGAS